MIIGIDSLDPLVIDKYIDHLPNFARLSLSSPKYELSSIFPVDSIPAWVSIYTGLTPARHGIVKTYDIFDKTQADILKIGTGSFQGRTFWDFASQAGKKVCLINPFLAFPPWPINGFMLSRSMTETKPPHAKPWTGQAELRAYPPELASDLKLPSNVQGVFGKHPGPNNLLDWARDAETAIIRDAEIGLKVCREIEWDLFFIYFSWLDIVQHRLWRYFDIDDPTHPTDKRKESIILEFYKRVDTIVGSFQTLCPDVPLIVLSDHGHGMRPTQTVNVNRALREHGIYYANSKASHIGKYVLEKLKVTLLAFSDRLDLDHLVVNLSTKTKALSNLSKDIYMSSAASRKTDYLACLSAFAGVKSYPHGGIEIHPEVLPQSLGYEELREQIISILLTLRDPHNGEKLLVWACRREELYPGNLNPDMYPDIVFQLREEYGTGWNVFGNLIGKAHDHKLASGGHRKSAVFLTANLKSAPKRTSLTLMDVAPSILDILGVNVDHEMDGKSIFS
jgi:predicted AlkP superfamily phosphohydrolase/phosphomutase